MKINRYQEFKFKNEDTILDECGYPEAFSIIDVLPFYKANETLVFMFVEEDDIEWKVKPDAFSYSITLDPITNKTKLVGEIEGKDVAVFIRNNKSYTFYGLFKLANPYIEISGAGKVIEPHKALDFYFEKEEYVL